MADKGPELKSCEMCGKKRDPLTPYVIGQEDRMVCLECGGRLDEVLASVWEGMKGLRGHR